MLGRGQPLQEMNTKQKHEISSNHLKHSQTKKSICIFKRLFSLNKRRILTVHDPQAPTNYLRAATMFLFFEILVVIKCIYHKIYHLNHF